MKTVEITYKGTHKTTSFKIKMPKNWQIHQSLPILNVPIWEIHAPQPQRIVGYIQLKNTEQDRQYYIVTNAQTGKTTIHPHFERKPISQMKPFQK